MPDVQLLRAARILAAASERGRIRMLVILFDGPAFVSELARRAGVRLAHASQQLAVLREADLVRPRRRGQQVEYVLADKHVRTLVEMAFAFAEGRR